MPKAIKPQEIKAPELTEAEKIARSTDIANLVQMRADRDQKHPELDDMTYIQYYESNRKKDLSYLKPKENKQDIRISTGLTREKDTTLLSTMLNMNFVPDVTAFDKDDMVVQELGDNLADLVKKSREIENWQKKRPIIYRELIAQGDVFVQEIHTADFRQMPLEDVEWNPETDKITDFNITTRLQKVFEGCAVRMVSGKKIYLGNIRTEYIEDQDRYAILNVYSRARAYSIYGTWDRWENIPDTIDTIDNFSDGETYKSWNLVTLGDTDRVAEVMLVDVIGNRFQIYLNGVPMLPPNFPLTAICPSGEGFMAQGKLEPISDFAYSKSQPSKTKIDQEVLDESTKLMIEGMRQGRKPPMGSRGKKVYAPGIFTAGKITPDIKEGDLFPLWQNMGLTAGDFSFYQLIKQGIEDKTVNKAYEGDSSKSDTLGQARQDKEQQMLKLGLALDGVVNLERRLTWLRIYGIMTYWTKKYDPHMDATREAIDGQYRKVSVNTTLPDGQKGTKIFRFTDGDYPHPRDHQLEEKKLTEEYGREVRIVYMNPEAMRAMKFSWFIVINPTPQSNDLLTQIMFVQNLRESLELFGPDAHNVEYLKQRFAVLMNEDYNKWFKKMDVMQMMQMGLDDPAVQNITGGGGNKTGPGMRGGLKSAAGGRSKPVQAGIQ